MRVAFVVVVLAVCGCNDPAGLELDVIASAPIARVEIIPAGPCQTCPDELAAPGTGLRSETALTSTQATRWTGDIVDGHAQFRILADGDADESLAVLAVLGFTADDTPVAFRPLRDVTIPGRQGAYWQVELGVDTTPVTGIDDAHQPDGTERIAVWHYPDQTEPSCVMVERWSDGARETAAIMPPGDPDCDHARPECLDNVPNAMNVPPPLNGASCGTTTTLPAGPACVLGGRPCTDGVGAATGCLPFTDNPMCVPQSVCQCADTDPGCAGGKFLNDSSMPYVQCTIPYEARTGKACGTGTAILDASKFVPGAVKCSAFHVLAGFLVGAHVTDTISVGQGTLSLSGFQTPCSVTVTAAGTFGSALTVELTDLELTNGKRLVMPFRVDTVAGCASGALIRCSAFASNTTSETLSNCAL